MARKQRIHYEGAIYHVIARGNNREDVFGEPGDKAKYLELLDRYKHKYDCKIHAYVLMDNHIHLLVSVTNTPLAKIMQGLQQTYTQYYNRKYQHVGHVFQQRYKAFLCGAEPYLLTLICYIHQNPVRAKINGGINYDWSSHKAYMRGHDSLVDTNLILGYLATDLAKAIEEYAEMAHTEIPASLLAPVQVNEMAILQKVEQDKISRDIKPGETTTWEELAMRISQEENIPLEQLLGNCRVRKVVSARNRLIYETIYANIMTRTELASRLNIDPARITRGYWQAAEHLFTINKLTDNSENRKKDSTLERET